MNAIVKTKCCIVGGGPAGMMLGFLLARAGIDVLVLEKHANFLRDFRGDTVHPSTLQVMHELGLLEKFLRRPHDKVKALRVTVGDTEVAVADFSHLRTHCKFIALMPQWEFLDFLRDEAQQFSSFRLLQNAQVTDVLEAAGVITGVQVQLPQGPLQVRADLVIGADGRHSRVREAAGLTVRDLGAPIDVLWMRLPKMPGDPTSTGGRINTGMFLAMLDRGTYWQCAYVIPKGGMDAVRARGLESFRADLVRIAPLFKNRTQALKSWDDIKLLRVKVDRLERWCRPGLLCLGDAAHAMSPIGGVGINLAIQDAVAAANLLTAPLTMGGKPEDLFQWLTRVEKRRLLPTHLTQAAQVTLQNRLLQPLLQAGTHRSAPAMTVPWQLKLLGRSSWLQTIPAYAVGVGVRPEHVWSHAGLHQPASSATLSR